MSVHEVGERRHAAMTGEEMRVARDLVERALHEDLGPDLLDLTAASVPESDVAAALVARADGVLCGTPVVRLVFDRYCALAGLTAGVQLDELVVDRSPVRRGDVLATAFGPARAMLTAERTALNFAQHLSGVATLTRRFVDAVAGTGTRIYDTRKTTPGMRALERYAVRCGGGYNHRFGLYDVAMVKDNHIDAAGGVQEAIAAVRERHPDADLVVEARTLDEVRAAVASRPDIVLLDNMDTSTLRAAVQLCGGAVVTEASGGVTLDTVREVAETRVDRISIGALTHSAPALDLALDVQQGRR